MSNEKPKKQYQILINSKQFEWIDQFITGQQVRKLGSVPEDEDLFLKINGQKEDELIMNETRVDLEKPGVEHFYSKEPQHKYEIIVNGRSKPWEKKQINFEEVIILAFGQYNDAPTMVYTVAYEDGPKQDPEGSMIKETVVFVKNKMIFHATATDKS